MTDILVLNGPNLNLLGTREPEIYGSETLADIEKASRAEAEKHGLTLDFVQTNTEGEMVDYIQKARKESKGIIINAAAYTHTSVAILDALKSVDIPVVEVHLSNIYKREEFRHKSYVSGAAVGVICGFGGQGYLFAVQALAKRLK